MLVMGGILCIPSIWATVIQTQHLDTTYPLSALTAKGIPLPLVPPTSVTACTVAGTRASHRSHYPA